MEQIEGRLGAVGLGLVTFVRPPLEVVSDTVAHSFGRALMVGLLGQVLVLPTFGMLVVDCITHDKQVQPADILYITEDGGRNWRTRPYPGGSLQMLDPRLGWALSRDIYQTTNGGRTWETFKTVNWDGQFDFINEKIGLAVARSDGRVAFVHTFDGRRSWVLLQPTIGKPSVHPPGSPTSVPLSTQTPTPTLQSIPAPRPMAEQPVTITYIDMIDATQGWAIGRFADTHDHVLSTRDGGLTWRDVTTRYSDISD